ncbi:MAG: 7-cyano-7-deazaguanine synthase QueC [Acidobacteriota bacterium]
MTLARELAVVLVSGGMDSCVTAAIAAQRHEVSFLHCTYGHRAEAREMRSFLALADHYRVQRRLTIRLDYLGAIGGSSLTDATRPVEEADLRREGVPGTYVPFRNAQMLAAGVAWAETTGAGWIYIGAVEEDSSGYPDCRRVFFERFQDVIAAGTRPETSIRIATPVIDLRKSAIVRRGIELEAPFHLTWSCYLGDELACGRCDSCALRRRAFAEAGVTDPVAYR